MDLSPEIQSKFDAFKEKLQCSDDELMNLLIETFESSQSPKKKYTAVAFAPRSYPAPGSANDIRHRLGIKNYSIADLRNIMR
jgi:hypothetical protein